MISERFPFFSYDMLSREDRIRALQQASKRVTAQATIESLRLNTRAKRPSPRREKMLDKLATPGTVAIIGGQQAGLFLGPAMNISKAISLIRYAEILEAESGIPCVPVFWSQVEDHDLEEICRVKLRPDCVISALTSAQSSVSLSSGDIMVDAAEIKSRIQINPSSSRMSSKYLPLGSGVRDALRQLSEELSSSGRQHAETLVKMLESHYLEEATYGDAFRGALEDLFDEEGLLVFDPRSPQIKDLVAPVYLTSMLKLSEIDDALAKRGVELKSLGRHEQIPPRPDISLTFYHGERENGPRYRLRRVADGWEPQGHTGLWSEQEIELAISSNPFRFSSSALLRPLVQDSLFATGAFVGGPAELDYLSQVTALYPIFQLPEPLFLPRGFFTLLEPKQAASLAELQTTTMDLQKPKDVLLRRLVKRPEGCESLREGLLARFRESIVWFKETTAPAPVGLDTSLKKTEQNALFLAKKLVDRYETLLGEQDRQLSGTISRLQSQLFPDEAPQERSISILLLAAKYGIRSIKSSLDKAFVPFSMTLHDVLIND